MKTILYLIISICLILTTIFFQASYAANKNITVTSSNFTNKGFIPDANACEFLGLDKSPQLSFSNVPSGTKSLALIVVDPDAPNKNFVHWIIYNIPGTSSSLEQDIPRSESLENGIKQGTNDAQQIGYFGPCPPPGETHRYIFKVFALDTTLTLSDDGNKKELTKAMKGHIIGKGKLVGLYKNKTNN